MKKGKILIVEDSRIVAEDIKQKLSGLGYTISAVATSGEQAIQAAEADRPDIALMDIRLGDGKNGIDTATELKANYQVPVIYLTAYADERTIERAKRTEPYGYIIKPFDDKELQSTIEIALHKHQMERELKVSKEWLQTALSSIGDGVIATDMQGRVNFMNPVAEALTGWLQEEAMGQPLPEVFHIINEISRKPCDNPVDKVIRTGQIIGLANHTLLISRNGREIPIKDSGSPIALNGTEMLGVILVFQDDTKSRKAEEALRKSEEQYRALFQYNPIESITVDKQCKITNYNLAKKNSVSRSPEIGDIMYRDYASKHDIDMYAELTESIRTSKIKHFSKARYIDRYLDITFAPFPMGAIITSMDITEKIEAQQKLEKSELKFRTILNSMQDAVYICSENFLVDYMNPVMIKRVGKDATGSACYRAIHGLEEQCPWCERHKLKEGISWESSVLSPMDGRSYLVNHIPLVQPDKAVSKLTVYRDVTNLLKIENKLRQSQKMEAIGNLAGGVAHDFNNILASIIGFTELALDEAGSGTVQEDNLQEVYAAAKRAKGLVKQILAFARQTGDEKKPVQVNRIVMEALRLIRSTIPSTIEIISNIASRSLTMADPTQIHQVVMNLCGNASDAMDEKGLLTVELKDAHLDSADLKLSPHLKPGDYIELIISDTGCGMSEETMGSIFDPYFTTKAAGEGTGMGLATVYGIVSQLGGDIVAESTLNRGSTFTVYLPITQTSERKAAYHAEKVSMGDEKILFVDDEVAITKMNNQALSSLGYSVTTRTSSIEALALFRNKPAEFDLIITDMTMPQMTGEQLAVELIKIRPDIPIILCTGYSKKISDETASAIGIKAFVYKPIVKADLAKTIRTVLDDAKSRKDRM